MVSERVTIKNPSDLHLRPAGILCDKAIMFQSLITLKSGIDSVANTKSVLSALGAYVKCGDETELVCEGDDEVEALAAMVGAMRGSLGGQDFQKSIIE